MNTFFSKQKYILALDQGTTGSRAFIFDQHGKIVADAYQEFKQFYPQPGWVEHDAEEIWQSCVSVIKHALAKTYLNPRQISAIGITNQRETTVIWDRKTHKPVHRAIVWQCRRTASMCAQADLKKAAAMIRNKTGLVLDPYFSGTKIKWLLDHIPGLRRKAEQGSVCFGTIDSWLIWKLTNGQVHATDVTNASRTLCFNIRRLEWDRELLKLLSIPESILAQVRESGTIFGHTGHGAAGLTDGIPIVAVMGDQQSALYGQGCYAPGTIKNTYGTGCFLVLNTGKKLIYSSEGLLSTIACDEKGKPVYALEGSVFIAGALVEWLRDGLKVIKASAASEVAMKKVSDTQGVYFVPAFTGLGAPYWKSDARGLITGLTRGTSVNHIIRAALESIAYQTKDVFDLMQKAYGRKIKILKVDGGACRNDSLMQFQADILGCPLIRPRTTESTVLGVAYLAGVTMGLWERRDLGKLQGVDKSFQPAMSFSQRQKLYQGWQRAVEQVV